MPRDRRRCRRAARPPMATPSTKSRPRAPARALPRSWRPGYHAGMKGKVVGILESRTGEHLAQLIERRGATPLLAPALEEMPDVNDRDLTALLAAWAARPFDSVIFQTGVGTKAL